MKTNIQRKLIFILCIISVFIFIVSFTSLYTQKAISCCNLENCIIPIPLLIPIMASVGLFFGSIVYYFMFGKIVKKDENIKKCSKVVGNLFSKEEKIILGILQKQKKISQAKLTHLAKMPRVKVFRLVEKLKNKGIIEKQIQGKTRIIKIKEDVKFFIDNLDFQ